MMTSTDTINLLIGGKAVAATGGRVFERRNPLDGSVARDRKSVG